MAQIFQVNVYKLNGNDTPGVQPMGFSPTRVKFRSVIGSPTAATPVTANGSRVYGIIEEYGPYGNNQYYTVEAVTALTALANA